MCKIYLADQRKIQLTGKANFQHNLEVFIALKFPFTLRVKLYENLITTVNN